MSRNGRPKERLDELGRAVTYWPPMMRLPFLVLLAGPAWAADPPAPSTPAAPTAAPTAVTTPATPGVEATRDGLRVHADLRSEYVAGFPMLVEVTVHNDTDTPRTFPDLAARPHLVHFLFQYERKRVDRFTTPPAVEPGATWKLGPKGQRRVLLEVPLSAGLDPGAVTLEVKVADPAGEVVLPALPIRLVAAAPVGGRPVWEPTIATTSGGLLPWVQRSSSGFDLYLLQFHASAPQKVAAQYHLQHLDAAAEPVLSRARAADSLSRWIYWQASPSTFAMVRLEGYRAPQRPRVVSVPFPQAEPLARGVSDAKGGLAIPVWIPAPKGAAGSVKVLTVDERGGVGLRAVVDLPARPTVTASAIDATSNLVLALGHDAAVDVYRVDATANAALPARGARVTRLEDGWTATALAFDTLPDQPERAGGLSLVAVVTRKAESGASARTLWADLGGRVIGESAAQPWLAPGPLVDFLPNGLGAWSWLARDAAGAFWYGAQGAAPVAVKDGAAGILWPSSDAIQLRTIVPGRVVEDKALAPRPP